MTSVEASSLSASPASSSASPAAVAASTAIVNSHRDRRDTVYAWVVLVASLLVQFLVMGLTLSIGVLYVEWSNAFSKDSLVSWVASLSNCFVFAFGPLSAFLVSSFGCRPVIFAGSLISTSGMVLSFFATQPYQLILSYGVLVGIGSSLMYIPAVTSVPEWFAKYKNMAAGISVIGVNVGCICYPPLLIAVIDKYTWRGGMLILAGLQLQVAFLATLLRSGDFGEDESSSAAGKTVEASATDGAAAAGSQASSASSSNQRKPRRRSFWAKRRRSLRDLTFIQFQASSTSSRRRPATVSIDLPALQIERLWRLMRTSFSSSSSSLSSSVATVEKDEPMSSPSSPARIPPPMTSTQTTALGGREDSCLDGVSCRSSTNDDANSHHSHEPQPPEDDEVTGSDGRSSRCSCIGLDLLRHPSFYAFAAAEMLWNIGMFMVYSIGPDYAVSLGVSNENAALLVTMLSACGTVGQLLIGPLDACCQPNTLLLFAISIFGTGPFILLIAFTGGSFGLLSAWMSIYGLWAGLQNGVLPVVHSDYYESRGVRGSAFGYVMLADGLGGLVAPLLAARLYSDTASYAVAFYCGSATSFAAAVICLTVFLVSGQECRNRGAVGRVGAAGSGVFDLGDLEADGTEDGAGGGYGGGGVWDGVLLTQDRYGDVVVFSQTPAAAAAAAAASAKDGVAQTELSQAGMSPKLLVEFSRHRWRR